MWAFSKFNSLWQKMILLKYSDQNLQVTHCIHPVMNQFMHLFIYFQLCLAVIAAHYLCCDESRGEDVPGGAGW